MTNPEHDYAAEERMRGAAREMHAALLVAKQALDKFAPERVIERTVVDDAIAKAEGRS